MAGHLAAVPEESTNGFTAPYPPSNVYRELIRGVVASGGHVRSTPFYHSSHNGFSYFSHTGYSYSSGSSYSGHSGSSYSGHSGSSYSGHNGSSYNSSAMAADSSDHELMKVARRMVSDGYTQCMVQAFEYNGGLDRVLETWFFELDVDWVLRMREGHGSQFEDKSVSSLEDLAERWIRALTVIAVTIKVVSAHETPAVARFCKASISAMLVFVDNVVSVIKVEMLGAVLDMFVCVSCVSHLFTPIVISPEEAEITFDEIGVSLEGEGNRLKEAIFSTMEEVRTLMEDDYLWAIEIPQGKGEVHMNTRLMVNCIISMVKVQGSTKMSSWRSSWRRDIKSISGLIDDSVHYLKDLLLRKSELCSEPSLRYMFLLNNSYFVAAQLSEIRIRDRRLTPECEKYMESYLIVSWEHVLSCIPQTVSMDSSLDVSWGHLLSCIPKMGFRGKNTSSLVKFEAAFHKTYQAQKFWKVPDPWLRGLLRKAIIQRIISGYRHYLKEHPELEKYVSGRSSSPDVLEEMLGELFEG